MSGGSRRFSKWSWAFPTGAHHQLIVAAIGRDDAESLAAAQNWLATQDIDAAPFRDHRLLLAIVARFGSALGDQSAYPRLIGLQRLLWTKSRLAIQEATSSLNNLRAAGIELMLIKGASRLAIDQSADKQRVAWDIDVVVKSECMVRAFDILVAENWRPSPGTSPQFLRERMASTRGINLFRGDYGDLDLHSRPFHPGQGGDREDAGLWDTALTANFAGTTVRVPCSEDRIALSLAHGGLDGHTHSDWLVDCALVLRKESCNWRRLEEILLSRHLAAPAAIAFHYLSDRLGFDVPAGFLAQLSRAASRRPLHLVTSLIQSRPKDRSGAAGQVLRGLAKKHRKVSGSRQLPARVKDRRLSVRRVPAIDASGGDGFVVAYRLSRSPQILMKGTLDIDILLDMPPVSVRRRIEMEINSASAHLCRIRLRPWRKQNGPVRLRLTGTIANPATDELIELVSRPGKQLRRYATAAERERYESVPFRVISCEIR